MTSKTNNLPIQQLDKLFEVRPETGELVWKTGHKEGKVAGTKDYNGYVRVQVDGAAYKAHRLVWALIHGEYPNGDLDHANGVKDDNRPVNLREASRTSNLANTGLKRNNTSGKKGCSWDKSKGKWSSKIQVNGRTLNLGRFDDIDQAHAAYMEAAQRHFGEFARGK